MYIWTKFVYHVESWVGHEIRLGSPRLGLHNQFPIPGRERHIWLHDYPPGARRAGEERREDRRAPEDTTKPAGWNQDRSRPCEGPTLTGSSGRGK
ncbi:hypothetical protein NQ315_017234 [Exocentrus adspersus]|uniref:Uncharacterized protein n=1 Tax=Exocentrus adspersus TaxID=1586481 RepID=A0AAV8VFI1_9CUCU|nr:hypothetical protein NQ315_017234 [Exocentrus adspersus]